MNVPRRIFLIAAGLLFPVFSLRANPDLSTASIYFEIGLQYQKADESEKKGDYVEALCGFKWTKECFEHFQQMRPGWEADLIAKRIKDCGDDIAKLEPMAVAQILEPSQSPLSFGPSFSRLHDEGSRLEDEKLYHPAYIKLNEYLLFLETIHQSDRNWETTEIEKRIQATKIDLDRLRALALKELRLK